MTSSDLWNDVGAIAAYAGVGVGMMLVGYAMIDMLTPGKLHELIWEQRNTNACILVSVNVVSVAAIIVAAIRSAHGDLTDGLIRTAVFSILGMLIMAVFFVILDILTPGKLGAMMVATERHPAVWVTAASHLAIAAVITAAIS
ncbi:DUF350 domain-containing protein [Allobranchiibius huperziae]|uniref:Uncharacterized membrane protein YjfL (UPF0719 family) n=1 Tax=Allobranchiibius huperziae TaxID=1874116 RepID=A0A853DKJ3_9MICO|nr:DUF350 domain-containing protein [Allobranchiibius huperziae]NYJ75251.1 uncharacterized membrane protein YjfL (UPF0719 family) [Allobranchiibius huperziae]